YKNIRNMSEKGGFDIIGHLDVVKKTNINSIYFDETEEWYTKEIKKTLECIADNKQIIEINTGNIIHDKSRIYPSPWILKIANEYRVPVMLNSDAHRPDRLDNYFEQAREMIKNAGYRDIKILIDKNWENDRII
ncbi:MAG: histidinol phosphatase, partial [Spirochaetia bacterium]|nr:histidinol phosphatase [Spirochaetia bacterium]